MAPLRCGAPFSCALIKLHKRLCCLFSRVHRKQLNLLKETFITCTKACKETTFFWLQKMWYGWVACSRLQKGRVFKNTRKSLNRSRFPSVFQLSEYRRLFIIIIPEWNSSQGLDIHLIFPFVYHFLACQVDVVPGTRSIFGLKRAVKSNCQAPLSLFFFFDAVDRSPVCQSEKRTAARVEFPELNGRGRTRSSFSARVRLECSGSDVNIRRPCWLSNKAQQQTAALMVDTEGHLNLDKCSQKLWIDSDS